VRVTDNQNTGGWTIPTILASVYVYEVAYPNFRKFISVLRKDEKRLLSNSNTFNISYVPRRGIASLTYARRQPIKPVLIPVVN